MQPTQLIHIPNSYIAWDQFRKGYPLCSQPIYLFLYVAPSRLYDNFSNHDETFHPPCDF